MERSSKFLTQRARPGSNKLITTEELCSMSHLVELLNRESLRMTDRVSSGLQLSLQGQNILYIQAFDDSRRQELANTLEKEKWKNSNLEFQVILDRVEMLPRISEAFKEKQVENGENNNEEDVSTLMEKFPGAIIVSFFTISIFDTGAKYLNLSKNSHFENLIFHEIHIFEISFFTKFTFLKYQF